MVSYFASLGQSFKDLRDNPILIMPFLLQSLTLILLLFILFILCAGVIFVKMGFTADSFTTEQAFSDAFSAVAWTPGLIVTIIVVAALFLFLLSLVSSWFTAGSLAMVNEAVEGKRPSAKAFFEAGRVLTWRLFGYYLVQGLLIIAAAAPAALFIYLAIVQKQWSVVFILLAVIFVILFILAGLLILLSFFFTQPILVRERLGTLAAMERSARILKERTRHVILTILTLLVVTVGISIVLGIVTLPLSMAAGTQPGSSALQILVFVVELIKNLLYILLSIVAALFLFRMYNEVKIGAQAPTATRKKAKKR